MIPPIAVVLSCMLAGLGALVGVGMHLYRHGTRRAWVWVCLPLGALMSFGFASVSIGVGEGVWGVGSTAMWLTLGVGAAGVVLQVIGWRAVLRPRLRPSQCPACGYERGELRRCPECGAGRGPR